MTPGRASPASWRELRALVGGLSRFLSPRHKRLLAVTSLWACAVSLLEMAVAAAVVPYVQCLSGTCSGTIEALARAAGWPLVPALSAGLLALITLKLAVQARLCWGAADFNQQLQRDTVSRLLAHYLHLDWSGFGAQHRAHYLQRCATTAVDAAWVGQQCVTLIAAALMIACLAGLMLWRYPLVSLVLGACFLAVNTGTQRAIGRRQQRMALAREAALRRWSVGMSEAFAAFREIRVGGREAFFLGQIERALEALAAANQRLSFLPALPRLVIDYALFAVLLGAVSGWLLLRQPLAELLPQLIFFGVAARAMLPATMNLLGTRAVLAGSIANVELVLEEFERGAARRVACVAVAVQRGERAGFGFERVSFRHAVDGPPLLADTSFELPHPSWTAVVGASGAGKSTLLELLCGLRAPQAGRVVHGWPEGQRAPRIAYLPQQLALLDASVRENVVFGCERDDPVEVHAALQLACLAEVVEQLPGGIEAPVGADGARLSGGERQRLVLARALYRRPDLLLLDEATCGLDEAIEARLLAGLRSARPQLSVLYVTHRSACLRFADRVLQLEGGALKTSDAAHAAP